MRHLNTGSFVNAFVSAVQRCCVHLETQSWVRGRRADQGV